MPATETLLVGATQGFFTLSSGYTAGVSGSFGLTGSFVDHGGSFINGPVEVLVGRNRPPSERRYFVVNRTFASVISVVNISPGYVDDQNFIAGDSVDVISAWETQRRQKAFSEFHTHGGGVDGSQVDHVSLANKGTNTHAQVDTHLADTTNHHAFATPAIALGSAAAAGSASTVIRSDGTIAAFDATVPVTQAFGDAAAVGSAAFAARRDHKHGMPAGSDWANWTVAALTQSGALTTSASRTRYAVDRKIIFVQFSFTFSNAGTALNAVTLTVPAALTAAAANLIVGSFGFQDQSVAWYVGSLFMPTTTTVVGIIHTGTAIPGGIGVNPNFAVASGDIWVGQMCYEGA